MTRLITLEGLEGCFKSTQTDLLVEHLKEQGHRVLQVKEPGAYQLPLTMKLRSIMLDMQYDNQHTVLSRELISQSIRAILLEKLIVPAIKSERYDFIISDRGVFSSVAYAAACGNSDDVINQLTDITHSGTGLGYNSYEIVFLKRDIETGLEDAKATKREFEVGDAMENKGVSFLETVKEQFDYWSDSFNVKYVDVENKDKQTILNEITTMLEV